MKSKMLLASLFTMLAVSANFASADDAVVTLEVTPSSPAPGAPGTWELFGRIEETGVGVDGSFGIAAIRALLVDIDFGTEGDAITLVDDIGAINPIDEGGPNERLPFLLLDDGTIDIIYGQDISDGPSVVPFVGVGGDALIAFGTYSAGLSPSFGKDMANPDNIKFTDGNFLNTDTPPFGAAVPPDNVFTVVRVIPEPTSLALLLICGIALTNQRRLRS